MKRKLISALLLATMVSATVPPYTYAENIDIALDIATNKYDLNTFERPVENLDRGLVAMKTDKGIYLSWRLYNSEDTLFGSAEKNVEFAIFRDGEEITRESNTTNYLDKNGTMQSRYSVAPIINGSTGDISDSISAFESEENYFDIQLSVPEDATTQNGETKAYAVNDCSCGDLDGDGEYEIVVKWVAGISHMMDGGFDGPILLDAYELDGRRMWKNPINLGYNVFSDEHNMQFLVFDFDEDGHSEITCQTSAGSKDSSGKFVNEVSLDESVKAIDNSAEYIDINGRILTGAELFTIFDGTDGRAIDTIYYPIPRCDVNIFGDYKGNRATRFLADVSYLDGEKPYAVYWRGYYAQRDNPTVGRTGVFGASFDGERLNPKYVFDTYDVENSMYADGYTGIPAYTEGNEIYIKQGNHNMTTADVDGDGKDEFISGSLCFEVNDEDKLMPKWCSFRGHGDALHIGDYDPEHAGFEYFSVHEEGYETITDTSGNETQISNIVTLPDGTQKTLDFGMTLYDAATGNELFHHPSNRDTGRGVMANIGAGGYFSINGSGKYVVSANGEAIESDGDVGTNFRIFWDGDLFDEILDVETASENGQRMFVYKWDGNELRKIFITDGAISINGTKSNPSLQADILGDWREELILPTEDGMNLRVFTTNIPTKYKMQTLMHDSVYRAGVASEQTAYNQPPHIGFYLNEKLFDNYPTFDENAHFADDFSSYFSTGLKGQGTVAQSSQLGNLELAVGYRDNGGDGISQIDLAMNALSLVSGNTATAERGASFTFSDECAIPAYADIKDGKLIDMQFDMMFTDENSTLQIFGLTSNDTSSVNDPYLSAANSPDIPFNEWVHVRFLINQDGNTTLQISQDNESISTQSFNASGEYIEKFATYGNASVVCIDNLEVKETDDNFSTLTVTVVDENDSPLKKASVTIDGKTIVTDNDGKAIFILNIGTTYPFSVSKPGYIGNIPSEIEITDKNTNVKYQLNLSDYTPVLDKIELSGGAQFISAPYSKKITVSEQFTAKAYDQYENPIEDININWSITPANQYIRIENGFIIVKNGFKPENGHEEIYTVTSEVSYDTIIKKASTKISVNDYMFYEPGTGCYGGEINTLPTSQETTITIPLTTKSEYMTLPEAIRFTPGSAKKLTFKARIDVKDIYTFKRYFELLDEDGTSATGPLCFATNKLGLNGSYDRTTKGWVWDNPDIILGDFPNNTWVNVSMLFETDSDSNTTVTIKCGDGTETTLSVSSKDISQIHFGTTGANSQRMIGFKDFIITDETENPVPPVFEEDDTIKSSIHLYDKNGDELESITNGNVAVKVNISDNAGTLIGKYVDVYTAMYDDNDTLKSIDKQTVLMYQPNHIITVSDNVPEGVNSISAFIWEKDTMIPIAEKEDLK